MPAISVVIPVYNAAPFLREALDSLLAQTCGDFEAIAVNDGSTDNSLEILQEYAARDSRIRILDGPNGGYGKAMNRGMDASTGKYLAILEPDDYLPREAYAILLPLAEEHQLDVVRGSHYAFFGEPGQREFWYRVPAYRTGEVFCPLDDVPGVFRCGPGIWCNLYNLEFLRAHQIRFHESPGASYQDAGFFFLCTVHARRYMLIPDAVYVYRLDNPSSSVKVADNKRMALFAEYEYIYSELNRNGEVWKRSKSAFYWCFMNIQGWFYQQLREASQADYLETLTRYVKRYMADDGVLQETRELMETVAEGRWQDRLMAENNQATIENPLEKSISFMGVKWYSKKMCPQYTKFYLLGILVCHRERMRRWQRLPSGVSVANGLMNQYFLCGIPIFRKWYVRCGAPMSGGLVPARVSQTL